MTRVLSCGETGWDGRNEVNEWGGNYWVDSVAGGSNQTYLYLQVGGEQIFLGRIFTTNLRNLGRRRCGCCYRRAAVLGAGDLAAAAGEDWARGRHVTHRET